MRISYPKIRSRLKFSIWRFMGLMTLFLFLASATGCVAMLTAVASLFGSVLGIIGTGVSIYGAVSSQSANEPYYDYYPEAEEEWLAQQAELYELENAPTANQNFLEAVLGLPAGTTSNPLGLIGALVMVYLLFFRRK